MSLLDTYTDMTRAEADYEVRGEIERRLAHLHSCPALEFWDDVAIEIRDDVLNTAYKLGNDAAIGAYVRRQMEEHLEAARVKAIRGCEP